MIDVANKQRAKACCSGWGCVGVCDMRNRFFLAQLEHLGKSISHTEVALFPLTKVNLNVRYVVNMYRIARIWELGQEL